MVSNVIKINPACARHKKNFQETNIFVIFLRDVLCICLIFVLNAAQVAATHTGSYHRDILFLCYTFEMARHCC